MRRRRGWVLLDMISALILLSITAGILAGGMYSEQVTLRHLSDSRAATRAAESALTAMQHGSPAAFLTPDDTQIHVRILPQPSQSQQLVWAEVKVTLNKSTATLTGLVPSRAVASADGGVR